MKQRFRFAELYHDNCAAVEKTLTAMWCGKAYNESQKGYIKQLTALIPEVFAPKDAMPLVQCMNAYEEVYPEHVQEAEDMLGKLWRKSLRNPDKYYPPYEHQYQCWKTLLKDKTPDGKNRSIVVYTGTGSGKTECFMLPLVQDLLDNYVEGKVQAIFLYPLNALMEDQKERLQRLLSGTDLKFAVYNSDMPERIPSPEDRNYNKVMRKIDAIRGVTRKADGSEEVAFPNIIATRDELRHHPANILLTNPTMLEYIMLRDSDRRLVPEQENGEKGCLRWIALDETHTYTGAGATELAMLLRRVLIAYGVTPDDVRFATSSATLGKGDCAEEDMKQFIASLTDLQLSQVQPIGGKRKGIDRIPDDEYKAYWHHLIEDNHDGYLRLDELFDNSTEPIETLLKRLDTMCQRAEDEGLEDLRVKVHYFYRVPNHGLYVDLNDAHYREDGSFKVYAENMPKGHSAEDAPLLEMSRCKHCGEYLAIAEEMKTDEGIAYQPITMDDSDMFDLDYVEEGKKTYYVFGTTQSNETEYDNNIPYIIDGNRLLNVTSVNPAPRGWHIIANTQCQCPYCGTRLYKQTKADEDNPDAVQNDEEDRKKLQKFRVASDFMSQLIAPSTLDLMTKAKPKKVGHLSLHDGQQYISFVDSRQMAARSTIKQNLEEERLWVYSTIYHELSRMATAGTMTISEATKHFEDIYSSTPRKSAEHKEAEEKLGILEGDDQEAIAKLLAELKSKNFLTWEEILNLLLDNRLSDTFCQQFAERSELSPELDENGDIKPEVKRKYLLAIMVDYLSKRPLTAAAPETMGLFSSYYADLECVLTDELPDAVNEFNGKLSEVNRITKKDWYGLMKIFLDLTVRSNQSVFLKMNDTDSVDIFQCVRFATQKESRRPAHKPMVKDKGDNRSRVIRLIGRLIANDKSLSLNNAISSYKDDIQAVINCMWDELTLKYKLLEHSTHYDDDETVRQHVKDADEVKDGEHSTPYRLNLNKLAFKLYEDVYLCDTNTGRDNNHVEWLRPVDTTFHGYAPFLIGGEVVALDERKHEQWAAYPYHIYSSTPRPETEMVEAWAADNRKLMWNNGLWGNDGIFADHLLQIHQFPNLFIQAEHTAQVDKMISRQVQEDFKDHCINILACSTTMEMGVDLGDLELIMMTSVPPMPSNYKQRSGRSGRREQVRSACVTLCGSDAIGLRTLFNPMDNLILRQVNTPIVDMNNEQVIQRHINSFLIREFGVFGMAGGDISEQVLNYYSNYEIVRDGDSNHIRIKRKSDHTPVSPKDGLGASEGTPYEKFNAECLKPLSCRTKKNIRKLLDGTIYGGYPANYGVEKARKMNQECYDELELRIKDYAKPYEDARSDRQQAFFEMKFIEPLAARLLPYWAAHRFIPNANMPVKVIEFDVNSCTQKGYTALTVSNPSYPLRTALSQYAPGSPIVRDGIVRIVRGIRYSNFFRQGITFKKLYFNRERVVIDTKDELDTLEKWKVNGTTALDLLQPVEFIPDMNESATRILEKNVYTRVNAQLIGADEWNLDRIEPHLFDARNSRESGNGRILYYNEGVGYGYCHCTKCGKTVLENWPAVSSSNPDKLPCGMNDRHPEDEGKPDYHFSLVRKGKRPNRCLGCNKTDYIKRNVVLGDTITTDYTEIRIRHLEKDWIDSRGEEENLLITLGLLMTSSLSEELNIERSDLDFTITPNGHICVFDTNPGGSGYSNQLAAMDLIKAVIERSYKILKEVESTGGKDALMDRYTLHYLNNIDIQAAINWIEEEISARRVLPEEIRSVFGENVTETSLAQMLKEFVSPTGERYIFVDGDYCKWEYTNSEHCWKGQFFDRFAAYGQQTVFCVAWNFDNPMPTPVLDMVREISCWTKDVISIMNPYAGSHLYPLAYVGGRLYFTNNPAHITLNDDWGNGTIYYVPTANFALYANSIDTEIKNQTTKIFKLQGGDYEVIKTNMLGKIIQQKSDGIVDEFFSHCHNHHGEMVSVVYQDEHMKSILSIIFSLQTIGYMVKKIGNPFKLDFNIERYDSDSGKWDSITANLPSSYNKEQWGESMIGRDEWLKDLSRDWMEGIKNENNLEGEVLPILAKPRNTLTHWRVLTLECAGKRLSIYPDGGFMNGWHIHDNQWYPLDEITPDTVVTLRRYVDIKYDVEIETL